MKKTNRSISLLLILLLLTQCLCACSTPAEAPAETPEYLLTFTKCMRVAQIDWRCAMAYYCHWENEESKGAMLENAEKDIIVDYDILAHRQLNDNLWIIYCSLSTPYQTNVKLYKYVGLIDGRYYVMWNSDEIPDDMKEGLDLDAQTENGL